MPLDKLASRGLLLEEVCHKRLVSEGLSLKSVYFQEVIPQRFFRGHDSTKTCFPMLVFGGRVPSNDLSPKACPRRMYTFKELLLANSSLKDLPPKLKLLSFKTLSFESPSLERSPLERLLS